MVWRGVIKYTARRAIGGEKACFCIAAGRGVALGLGEDVYRREDTCKEREREGS